jgi:hypothetical protein
MAVHSEREKSVLFIWELRDRARRERWFYVNLKRVLEELSQVGRRSAAQFVW